MSTTSLDNERPGCWLVALALALVVSFCFTANASASKKKRRLPFYMPSEWRIATDLYVGGHLQTTTENSPYNPGNSILGLPNEEAFSHLRWNGSFRFRRLSFVARPRFSGLARSKPKTMPETDAKTAYGNAYMHELYAELRFSGSAQLAIGRQNYQYGPAELLSPSNFLFPELVAGLEPYHEVKGLTMARLNVTLDEWSWVTLAELNPIRDYTYELDPAREEKSLSRVLTKIEKGWNGGADYLGVSLGTRQRSDRTMPLGGLYAAWTPNETWQVYSDVLAGQGSDNPYPKSTGEISTDRVDDEMLRVFGLTGLRYTLESGTELRLEGIYNQFGYNTDEQGILLRMLKEGGLAQLAALSAVYAGKSPMYGQSYAHGALRWTGTKPLLGFLEQPILGLRALVSLQDGSSFTSFFLEGGLSTHITMYAFGGLVSGQDGSDFRRLPDSMGGLTLKYSF